MLDPDAVAQFEEWREAKLKGTVDLSVEAFNLEMEATALAYEAAIHAAFKNPSKTEAELIADNPYRKPGMLGQRTRRVVSDPTLLPKPGGDPKLVNQHSMATAMQLPLGYSAGGLSARNARESLPVIALTDPEL